MTAIWIVLMCLQQPAEKPKAQEKEVIITGARKETDVLDTPSGVTVVTAPQIKESGATNILEVVQKQPGFFAQGQNKGAYDSLIDIRGYNNGGGNGQRTLVLVDGRKTNSVVGAFTDWATIPIDNIERIEIVRGPSGALYGDGALAGVVNIITKKGPKEFSGTSGAAGGTWSTYRLFTDAGGSSGDLRYDVFGAAEGTDGWRDHSLYRGNDLTGRFDFSINKTLAATVKVGHHNDRRQQPGTLNAQQIHADRDGADPTRIGDTDVQEDYFDAGLVQNLEELGEASIFLNHSYRNHNLFSRQFGGVLADDQSQITMLQLKHVISPKAFGGKASFTTGADFSYETAAGDSGAPGAAPSETDYRRRLMGFYEGLEVRPVDPLVISGSFRYDRALLSLDKDVPTPPPFGQFDVNDQTAFDDLGGHLGASWRLAEGLSLYASWGRTFRLPTRDELVGFLVTSPGLVEERAKLYEAGFRVWSAPWGSGSVTFYRMDVHNELFFDSATFSEINFDRVVHDGIETEARITPSSWLELFGSWTYTKARVEEGLTPAQEGKIYPVTPKYAGFAGVTARVEGVTATLSGRYAGRRYLINDLENVAPTLPDYLVYDARVSYTWTRFTAYVSVFNFTNRRYNDSGGYGFGFGDRYSPAPERSWLFGAEVKF